jgi:hypothetical protein
MTQRQWTIRSDWTNCSAQQMCIAPAAIPLPRFKRHRRIVEFSATSQEDLITHGRAGKQQSRKVLSVVVCRLR